jgi:hypothetical protein
MDQTQQQELTGQYAFLFILTGMVIVVAFAGYVVLSSIVQGLTR